jgi:hypothetical protein
LIAATHRIRSRLGQRVTDRAVSHFAAGRPEAAIAAMLNYFDEAYTRRSAALSRRVCARVDVDEQPLRALLSR